MFFSKGLGSGVDAPDADSEMVKGKLLSEFSDESIRDIAREIVVKKLALLIHIAVYLFVNALLLGINYAVNHFNAGISDVWALWSILGWGIGLCIHVLSYIIFRKGIVRLSVIGLLYHGFIFVIVEAFLIFVDWRPDSIISWSLWPLYMWGIAVALHAAVVLVIIPRKESKKNVLDESNESIEVKKSWMERQVEKELQKIDNN